MSSSGKKKKEKGKLPEHLEIQRTRVICGSDLNYHPGTSTSASMYLPMGVDNSWDFEEFKDNFRIHINYSNPEAMEFDMIGCDPSIANALRRILIAEIPTVAVEHVFMVNNTSLIQDEVLAHRLGLVPLLIDASLLDERMGEESAGEKNTVVFKLDVTCKRQGGQIVNSKVFTKDLVWLPGGSEMPDETQCRFASGQATNFAGRQAPQPVHDDILLAKLRPGQTIQLEAHCTKGIGKTHAKWSPVATAWYRLKPEVVLLQDVRTESEVGQTLLSSAPGLFFDKGGHLGVGEARGHEKHLEKIRTLTEHEEYNRAVQVRKIKDHFIFTIESTGVMPPAELFKASLTCLAEKAGRLSGLV